jgi:hypothetical protein
MKAGTKSWRREAAYIAVWMLVFGTCLNAQEPRNADAQTDPPKKIARPNEAIAIKSEPFDGASVEKMAQKDDA